jgi:hypothetical protein
MNNGITLMELVEQLSALERRLNERFDLLERMVALGFDDTSDQIRLRFGDLDVLRDRSSTISSTPSVTARGA